MGDRNDTSPYVFPALSIRHPVLSVRLSGEGRNPGKPLIQREVYVYKAPCGV